MKQVKIEKEEILFNDKLVVQKGHLSFSENGSKKQFDRLRVKRPDAVAVFIYNRESEKVILTRQFRYAIADKVKEPVLEIMAGKIDGSDSPLETAVREAEEECGYKVKKENLRPLAEFFASPGYTSEKFYLYYAEVTNTDKTSGGGGLADENEYIEIVELSYSEFIGLLEAGKIEDGKTLMAGLLVQRLNLIDKS